MVSREDRRAQLVPAVARLLRARDSRFLLSEATGRAEKHTIIVVLDDDSMSYLYARLADADGTALAVMARDDDFEMAIMRPASEARIEVAVEDDRLAMIHDDSPVGMFFDYLREVRCLVWSRVAAQMIDNRELEPA